jgi:hypothetical protein
VEFCILGATNGRTTNVTEQKPEPKKANYLQLNVQGAFKEAKELTGDPTAAAVLVVAYLLVDIRNELKNLK